MPKPDLHRLADELCDEFLQLVDDWPYLAVAFAIVPDELPEPIVQTRQWAGRTFQTIAPLQLWHAVLGEGEWGPRVPFDARTFRMAPDARPFDYVYYDMRGESQNGQSGPMDSPRLSTVYDRFEVFQNAAHQHFHFGIFDMIGCLNIQPLEVKEPCLGEWIVFAPKCSLFELYADMMQHYSDTISPTVLDVPCSSDSDRQVFLAILSSLDVWCWEIWIEWLAMKRRKMDEDRFAGLTETFALLARTCNIDPGPFLELERWLAYNEITVESRPDSDLLEKLLLTCSRLEIDITVLAAAPSDSEDGNSAHVVSQSMRHQMHCEGRPSEALQPLHTRCPSKSNHRPANQNGTEECLSQSKQDAAQQLLDDFLALAKEYPYISSAIAKQNDSVNCLTVQREWMDQWSLLTAADEHVWLGALGKGPFGRILPLWAWWPHVDGRMVECVDFDNRGWPDTKLKRRHVAQAFWRGVEKGDILAEDAAKSFGLRWLHVFKLVAEPPVSVVDKEGVVWEVHKLPCCLYEAYSRAIEKLMADGIDVNAEIHRRVLARDYSPANIVDLTHEWQEEVLFHRIGFGGRGALPDEEFHEITESLSLIAEKWQIDSSPLRKLAHLIGHVGDMGSRHTSLEFVRFPEFDEASLVVERIGTIAEGMIPDSGIPDRTVKPGNETPVYLGDARYQCGHDVIQLEYAENRVLSRLVELQVAKKPDLEKVSENALSILRSICRKKAYEALHQHIIFPGGKGKGGYRTTIRPVSPDVFG